MDKFYNHPIINQSELARRIGISPQLFRQKAKKINRNKFTDAQLQKIYAIRKQFLNDIAIVLIVWIFASCKVTYRTESMVYRVDKVYPAVNCVVHQMTSLSGKYYYDITPEAQMYSEGDTCLVKTVVKKWGMFSSRTDYFGR